MFDNRNRPAINRQQRILQSFHYKNGAFQNVEPTAVMEKGRMLKTFSAFMHKPADTVPPKPLPVVKTDLKHLQAEDAPVVVWFGHSSYLLQFKGITILVDPLLQSHASPVVLFGKPFAGTDVYHINDLPDIDLLILTHDHYDHLSFPVISQLHQRVKAICTSLGVGATLEKWGVPPEKITELDWREKVVYNNGLQLTALTARHFSGRTLKRNQTVWSSFVLNWEGYRMYIGGDSGYGKHFAEIGTAYGPFDIAFLECGQYGESWPLIHMKPEETAQAAKDLKANILMPVHWAKFTLALHPWNEPPERLLQSEAASNLTVVTPKIGEAFSLNQKLPQEKWWRRLD